MIKSNFWVDNGSKEAMKIYKIDQILDAIRTLWLNEPDKHLGQLLSDVAVMDFIELIEDDDLLDDIEIYLKNNYVD